MPIVRRRDLGFVWRDMEAWDMLRLRALSIPHDQDASTVTRHHRRYRLSRSLAMTRRLQRCEHYADAEVRFIWQGGEDWLTHGSPTQWDGMGYYWRTSPGKTWTMIGIGVHGARSWVRSKVYAETGRKPPAFGEVLGTLGDVLGLIGAGAGVVRGIRSN